MLENAGVPVPGETILLAGAALARFGHLSLPNVILVAVLGAVLGDNIGFFIGRRGGGGIRAIAQTMITLASGLSYFDLDFMQLPRIIATAVVHGPGEVVLIDPGPSSTLPRLRSTLAAAGISMRDVTTVLLTHIHLDHAGATGTLVRELPKLRVFVHEKGAAHMANPEKLVASATRLYGSEMDRLWGEVRPVPAANMEILQGGERMAVGHRMFDVEYTPGHASHHVSYFDRDSGVAFVGDTAGVRLMAGGVVMPPTPPPDIDLEAWHRSLARIERWRPDTLLLTHFGPSSPVAGHLSALRDHIGLAGT